MALSGSYSLVRSEGVLEHLIGNGIPEDQAKESVERGKGLEISIDGDKVTIKRIGDVNPQQNLIVNQEVEEKLPGDLTIKSKTLLNGDVLTVDSNVGDANFKREYTLVGSELTVVLSSSKPGVPTGKRIYKKE